MKNLKEIGNPNKEIKFFQEEIIKDCTQILEVWGDKDYLTKSNIASMKTGLDIINRLEREIKALQRKNKGEK